MGFLIYSYSILIFLHLRKCAILHCLPLQGKYGSGYFRKTHLGNIAGGSTQSIEGLHGIKAADIAKVISLEVISWINAAANHEHIGNAVLQQGLKQSFDIFLVQKLQVAIFLVVDQLCQIIRCIIFHGILSGRDKGSSKGIFAFQFTKVIFQSFDDSLSILRQNCPDRNRARIAALMGIGNIEVIFECGLPVAVTVEHGNTLGTTVYPSPKPLIPAMLTLDRKNGSCIRPLGIE